MVIVAVAKTVKCGFALARGPTLRFIPCHQLQMEKEIGIMIHGGILLMHTLTGWDVVSAFYVMRKKTTWAVR